MYSEQYNEYKKNNEKYLKLKGGGGDNDDFNTLDDILYEIKEEKDNINNEEYLGFGRDPGDFFTKLFSQKHEILFNCEYIHLFHYTALFEENIIYIEEEEFKTYESIEKKSTFGKI